jgi:hypothetical protein
MHYFYHGKKPVQKIGLLLRSFKKLPKVNNHPNGENLPNLVTLSSATK